MKQIQTTGLLKLILFFDSIGLVMIFYALYEMRKPDYITGIQVLVVCGMSIIVMFTFAYFKISKNNFILYGNGKVAIQRRSKKLNKTYWCPSGKWLIQKNEFQVTDILKYGYSYELFGKNIEFHHYRNGGLGIDMEVCFVLKNGEIIPFEYMYYSRKQINELCKYIFGLAALYPDGKFKSEIFK